MRARLSRWARTASATIACGLGSGLDGTAEYFESLGYRKARVMAVLAGLTEVAAGLGSRPASSPRLRLPV